MDRIWMTKNRLSKEYEDRVEYFLKFVIENGINPNYDTLHVHVSSVVTYKN